MSKYFFRGFSILVAPAEGPQRVFGPARASIAEADQAAPRDYPEGWTVVHAGTEVVPASRAVGLLRAEAWRAREWAAKLGKELVARGPAMEPEEGPGLEDSIESWEARAAEADRLHRNAERGAYGRKGAPKGLAALYALPSRLREAGLDLAAIAAMEPSTQEALASLGLAEAAREGDWPAQANALLAAA